MIAALIRWSVANRFFVVLAALAVIGTGVWAVRATAVDALPDLSDVQVVIRTSYPGQAPQIVENQVTYPLATTMLSVPGARVVRGYSFFGDSFVYVLFEDGTDLYWARSRVLEYLNQVQGRLPETARPALGPDATGVGWIYEYALVDRTGRHDLSQLRGLQDWFLRYELKSLPGVSEVASIGGMVRQYQVVLDPVKLAAYGVTHGQVVEAINRANGETGGSVLELAEAEYMVRAGGYLKTLDDFRARCPARRRRTPVLLGDVATIQIGPEMRRGIAELDGQGEVVGGVVVLRSGENARAVIKAVQARLTELKRSLPPGVEVVTTYDRSKLIDRAIENLTSKLAEEFIIVALVCGLFLWHARSALVAILTLPLGVLIAFIVMRLQGVNADIMSLGGIAIAIGAMVDAAVVMIENAHKKIERWEHDHPGERLAGDERWRVITDAAVEVGPALFFSLVIITLSFVPVFTLQAQEGRLFSPLAFTKTYAMAGAALLSVTLVPVLMGWLIRGRIPAERDNLLNRWLTAIYRPALDWVLDRPRTTLVIAALVFATTAWPLSQLGGEFIPPMDEGDLLYMPSALPGLSAAKASELLQQTDRMIRTVPEVKSVFGKAGRAESATDPAPLEMFETTIQFKPRDQWRPGMSPERLVEELDRAVQVPGLTNVWVPPIRNRIDMLATGIKSPIGVKVSGADLAELDRIAHDVEAVARRTPGVSSALAETAHGRSLCGRGHRPRRRREVRSQHRRLAGDRRRRHRRRDDRPDGRGAGALSDRRPLSARDQGQPGRPARPADPDAVRTADHAGNGGGGDGNRRPADVEDREWPASTWVYVDVRGRDLASVVKDLRAAVTRDVKLSPGVSIAYSGQFEFLERAAARLKLVVPATLLIIFVLLYVIFGRFDEAALVMGTLPFALTGGIWTLYLLGYHQSVATGVGFIALSGVAAEFGVVMLIYLKHALAERGETPDRSQVEAAVREGALLRVRPKAMTVAVILAGLLPILLGHGAGSEVMSRIAAPMIGGMLTAPLLSMLIVPAAYLLLRRRRARLVQLLQQGNTP